MRKVLWLIVCLMTMVTSANAQNRLVHITKMFQIEHNARYERYKRHIPHSDNYMGKDPTSFMSHFIIFGGGVGTGSINPTGNVRHESFDMDLICMNILVSAKFGSIEDTGEFSFDDCNSLQIGALIPIVGFGGEDWIGRKHKNQIFVAPIIGFISSDGTYVDGHYAHDWHNCDWWIDTTTTKYDNSIEYGGALMVKCGCGYLLGKFTNKSVGVSVGLCI